MARLLAASKFRARVEFNGKIRVVEADSPDELFNRVYWAIRDLTGREPLEEWP